MKGFKHLYLAGLLSPLLLGAAPRPNILLIMATCVDVAGAEYPAAVHNDPVPPMEGTSLAPAYGEAGK